ncbi:MAG: hypothetical protein C4547_00945 [Phycisphaerales bacterium]|nr:MAG: hypothetical protein C4547_00945 [Phycisphaerales bacterium]
MYCNHFGLQRRPFDDQPDPEFFCSTSAHEETLAAMDYDARHGSGVTLVVGEAGLGKSLLVRVLEKRLTSTHPIVRVTCMTGGRFDLLATIARKLDATRGQTRSRTRLVGRIQRVLGKLTGSRGTAILLVDQAERLMESDVRSLAMLTESESHADRPVQLFLVGQPRVHALLQQSGLETFRQRAAGARSLSAMTLDDTRAYVTGRWRHAGGGADARIFAEEALSLIHRCAGGNPRLVNRLCDAALVHAYGSGATGVSAAIIEEVWREMAADSAAPQAQTPVTAQTPAPAHTPATAQAPPAATLQPLAAAGRTDGRSGAVLEAHETDVDSVCVRRAGAAAGSAAAQTYHRGELLARQVEEMLGRGAAHLRRQESVARSTELLMGSAEAVMERLERTIRQAEACHAFLDRWGEDREQLERRLDGKVERACGALEALERKTLDVDETVEQFDQRMNALAERYEKRIAELENLLGDRLAGATPIIERIEELDAACRRAAQIEERLGEYAQKLLVSGENAQQRITHLMSSLTAGEETIGQLDAAARSAREAVEQCRADVSQRAEDIERIAATSAQIERNQQGMQERTTVIGDRVQVATAALEQLERGSLDAQQRIETAATTLRAMTQDAAALEETVQRCRTDHQAVAAAVEASPQRISHLRGLVDEVAERVDASETRATALSATLPETLDAWLERAKSIEWKTDECRARADRISADVDAATRRGDGAIAEIREAIGCAESIHHTVANCLINIGSACERIDDAKRKAAALGQTVDRVDDARRRCDEVAARFDDISRRCDDVAGRFDQFRRAAEDIERTAARLDDIQQVRAEAGDLLEKLNAGKGRADAACRTLESRVTDAHRQFNDYCGRLESTAAAAARELDRSEAIVGLLDDARQIREALTVEVGRANQKLEALGSHVAAASDVTRTLCDSTRAGHALLEQAQSVCQALAQVDEVKGRLQQVVEANDRAAGLVDTLHEATARAEANRQLVTELEKAFANMRELAEAAARRQDQLRTAREDASETLARLERALGSVEPSVEQLERLSTEAQRIASTQQQRAAQGESVAVVLEQRTREAADAGAALADRVESSAAAIGRRTRESAADLDAHVQRARAHIETLVADARAAGDAVQERTDQLALLGRDVEPLERSVHTALAQAQECAAALTEATQKAGSCRQALSAERREALEIAERLKSTIGVLRSAQGLSRSLQESIEGASEAADRATTAADEARTAATTLELCCQEARRVLNAQQEARQEAATVVERMSHLCQGGREVIASMAESQRFNESMVAELERRFHEGADLVSRADDLLRRIDERDLSMEAADRMLRELTTQAEELADRTAAIQQEVRTLQSEVTHAVSGPTSIVEDARNQAAQLENVCRAVRKVFTALSKTTLEANEKTGEFTRVSTEADERLRQLLTETDRASCTLQQWVEEAVRAQSRLDQTLARTPSIGATHPTATVERAAESLRRSLKPGEWNGGSGGKGARTGTGAGAGAATEPIDAPRTATPQSRVDEITAMIQDARRSAAEVKA